MNHDLPALLSEKIFPIENIQNFLAKHREIVAVYLFGSYATGRNHKGSDVDLAVMTTRLIPSGIRLKWETELSNYLRRDVDLIVFGQSGPLLKHQILKYGKLLADVSTKNRISQEVLARKEYLDSRHLYRKFFYPGVDNG